MKKRAFIPKNYRPDVPGSKLKELGSSSMSLTAFQALTGKILIISAKDDIVPNAFLKEIDLSREITRLYYDDLGVSWDFIFHKGVLKILMPEGVIRPKSIYHRHPGIAQDHPHYQKHLAFFEVLDVWEGNLIGQRRDHHHNFSKVYQAITTLRKAKRKVSDNSIKHPRSFFIKGSPALLGDIQIELIVKSCSNVRSKVVSKEEYGNWDFNNLNNLPTLFQEKINGKDIRVHVCQNNLWSLLVDSKDSIDYRYASKESIRYKNISLPETVVEFCKTVAELEQNRLIGIDLMLSEHEYFCLESNPGPGWSTFNHHSKKEFAQSVFNELQTR